MRKRIRGLRWYIAALLFLSTVINYIDRQTVSVLGPFIKSEYNWSYSDFALLIISFRAAYTIGQSLAGRLLDRWGTRRALSLTVAFYSLASIMGAFAIGLKSFSAFRFMLGLGEAANWPGATKAVSEWFPRRESGWAVALFDSGSSVGAAIAPALVLFLHRAFGSWRPAFVITGLLGLLWILLFRAVYRRPDEHPRISTEELQMIAADRMQVSSERPLAYRTLLRLQQTWGIIIGKTLTDPVWFFLTDWLAIYLVSKGYRLEQSLLAFWAPFLAADAGNFAAGGLSSYLIQRGWTVGSARKLVVAVSGAGMGLLAFTTVLDSFGGIVACFSVATFSYAALSTMVLNLPADVYPSSSVATVSGMSGSGAGIGTMIATYLIGRVADEVSSFEPVMLAASIVPLAAVAAVLLLVRNNRATEQGLVNRI